MKQVNENDYILTKEEYQNLCTMFYQVKSITKMFLSAAMSENDNDEVSDFQVCASSVLEVIDEKLKTIEPLLGK